MRGTVAWASPYWRWPGLDTGLQKDKTLTFGTPDDGPPHHWGRVSFAKSA